MSGLYRCKFKDARRLKRLAPRGALGCKVLHDIAQSERLHLHYTRYCLDGSGNLRRNLEAARQLHFAFGALPEYQHHADLAVAVRLCTASRLQSLCNSVERRANALAQP